MPNVVSPVWTRELVTAPNGAVVSTSDAKAHMRFEESDEDGYIDTLVSTAVEDVESFTRRKLLTQTWDFSRDLFPPGRCGMQIPHPPLSSVTSITYVDEDGVTQTMDSSKYVVETGMAPGVVNLAYDEDWPTVRDQPNAVTVRAVVGYGAASDVPARFVHAIKLLCEHWHRFASPVETVGTPREMPLTVDRLLWPLRVDAFF